jgi:hypothetical protein
MVLLGANTGSSDAEAWTASANLHSDADAVLRALTDPTSVACWAPVSFEVEGLAGGRLRTGSRERVSGSIAGVKATYDVEVTRADRQRLELVANGPVSLDVAYGLNEHEDGVIVEARVAIRRQRGFTAQVLRAAVAAVLSAGALRTALRRLESSLSGPREVELFAA